MKDQLIKILICPRCRSKLTLKAEHTDADEILEGTLQCTGCEASYTISRGVPRFVNADEYASTFSRQRMYVRRHFGSYLDDRSGDRLIEPSTGIPLAEFGGGLSLEVGCGYGRFLDTVDRAGGEIVGVDLSTHSVNLAFDFVGRRKRVHIVQCDLFSLPFPKASFERVFSIGVLHHTPNPKKALKAIAPYTKDGGRVSIWVYPPAMKRASNIWRKVTVHIPSQLLYAWCVINQAAFSWIRGLPGGWRFSTWIVPGADPVGNPSFWRRVMSDFDDLSPQFASVHTQEEIAVWFQEAGLRDITPLPRKSAVTAIKKRESGNETGRNVG